MPSSAAATPTPGVPPRAVSLDRLETELGVLLRRARRALADRARATHPDLTAPGYLILHKLHSFGPRRSSDLVEEFRIDKGAISRQVQQLVDLDLVTRSADPDDGRALMLSISENGAARLDATHDERRHLLEHRLGEWPDDELAVFVSQLGRYNASIAASGG